MPISGWPKNEFAQATKTKQENTAAWYKGNQADMKDKHANLAPTLPLSEAATKMIGENGCRAYF